jgi:uncharacterized RDD family membrane protein YckC
MTTPTNPGPTSPGPTNPGWYDDPQEPAQLRYFDGVVWTNHTTPRVTRQVVDPSLSAGPPSTGWQAPQSAGQPPHQQVPSGVQPGWNAPAYGGLTTRPSTPDGQPLASYWQRVGAYIIDGIIQFVLVLVVAGWLLVKGMQPLFDEFRRALESGDPQAFNHLNTTNVNYGYLLAFAIVAALLQFGYAVLFLSRTGATPGKAALGISVRLRERPGVLTVGTAARRTALQAGLSLLSNTPGVGFFASLAALVDLLWPAWDERKQALHDKLAATNVVVGRQPRP